MEIEIILPWEADKVAVNGKWHHHERPNLLGWSWMWHNHDILVNWKEFSRYLADGKWRS